MKLQTKKIIAREFLILFLVSVIGLTIFLCTYFYNSYIQRQIEVTTNGNSIITHLADSLAKPVESKSKKHKWLFNNFFEEYDMSDEKYNSPEKWWKRLEHQIKVDSLGIKWKTLWDENQIAFFKKLGFESPIKLQEFILTYSITYTDIRNKKEAEKLFKEVAESKIEKHNLEGKILSYNDQITVGIKSLIVLLILFFGIRYIIYGVKWSLKILKEKPE